MLAVIMVCVVVGLFMPRSGRYEHLILTLLMTGMTALYLVFGERFM